MPASTRMCETLAVQVALARLAMHRTSLLIVTAVIELGAGLLLLSFPAMPLALLLGVDRAAPEATIIARIAGAALLSLGIACWLARTEEASRAATGLITAMLLYNSAVAVLLAYARIGEGLTGVALWPAVLLHAVMGGWCLGCLSRPMNRAGT